MGTGGAFLEVKRPEREADHSPPSSVEVQNEWSYNSTPPICLTATLNFFTLISFCLFNYL